MNRDLVESRLLGAIPHLQPLTAQHIPVINHFKDGNFGRSILGTLLYANGHNLLSQSTLDPRGLVYYDGNTLFGVGVFYRKEAPDLPCIHIIAPTGSNVLNVVTDFAHQVKVQVPQAQIFSRYIDKKLHEQLSGFASGWTCDPNIVRWNSFIVPYEDESQRSSIISLDGRLTTREKGLVNNVPWIHGDDKSKAARRCRKYDKFLQANGIEFCIREFIQDQDFQAVKDLVTEHFSNKKNRIGSTAEDYTNLLSLSSEEESAAGIKRLVIEINSVTMAIVAIEDLGNRTAGVYCNIMCRDPNRIGINLNEVDAKTHETCSTTFLNAMMLHYCRDLGFDKVKLGCSETRDLDHSKRLLGATPDETSWFRYVMSGSEVDYSRCNGLRKLALTDYEIRQQLTR